MTRHDSPADRDGLWSTRRYVDEPHEPCAVCGSAQRIVAFRWVHTASGTVCCGACRYTVHALTTTAQRGAPRPDSTRQPLPGTDDKGLW